MGNPGSANPAGVLLKETEPVFDQIPELGSDTKYGGHKFCEPIALCRSKEKAVYSSIPQTLQGVLGFRRWFLLADLVFDTMPVVIILLSVDL